MTNKRFTITKGYEEYIIIDNVNNGNVVGVCDVERICKVTCDLLNELNNENTQLKFQLKECREHKLFSRRQLEQENKELKHQLDICKKPLFSKKQLHQENQHIKHTIRVMMENERTEIGKNTLKQLWEAIQ